MSAVYVRGMRGLGDSIYQRAFVKALTLRGDAVYLSTPWPELVEDLPVRCVLDPTPLRTQTKNIERQPAETWIRPPADAKSIRVRYNSTALSQGSVVDAMAFCFGTSPASFNLPATIRRIPVDRPIAVVRPVTERTEWHNPARNCLPEYVAEVAGDLLRDYHVISVADLEDGKEWLVGDAPPAHERYHRGELGIRDLLGLIQAASVVVGPVGWIVPAAIAAGVPLFCILGGQGGDNRPDRITDRRMGNLSYVGFGKPDRFCLCQDKRHACDKTIGNLPEQWAAFRRERDL